MKERAFFSQIATLGGASLATACCWVPLTLAVAGIGAAGLGHTLEQWRPFFYVLTAVLILYSFWEGFLRRPRSCAEEAKPCADQGGGGRRRQMQVFFVGHLVLVGVIFSVPWLLGLQGTMSAPEAQALEVLVAEGELSEMTIEIDGMTCVGCVGIVERALRSLDGVHRAEVNFEEERGEIYFDEARLTGDEIVERVIAEGYEVRAVAP